MTTHTNFHLKSSINRFHRIMVFDIDEEGHHPSYILYLVRFWCKQKLPGQLYIVVSPLFVNKYKYVIQTILNCKKYQVQLVEIKAHEYSKIESQRFRPLRYLAGWKLFCHYAQSLNATHGLIMYFDLFQLSSILSRSSPCPFSGIYFRPTFHYSSFENYVPSLQDSIRALRKKILLQRVLRNPMLKILFCLDPFAVKYICSTFETKTNIIHLPDPVEIYTDTITHVGSLRYHLGVKSNRKIFLLFGILNERKGIYEVLRALSHLPTSICARLCLLLVGPVDSAQREHLKAQITQAHKTLPVQIVLQDTLVPEPDIQTYFHLADVVLATYQRHMGMSSIVIRAASAEKPVLASHYGLLGEIVQHHRLGLAVDSKHPEHIAQGIQQFVVREPNSLFDRTQALTYARENSVEHYASTLLKIMS